MTPRAEGTNPARKNLRKGEIAALRPPLPRGSTRPSRIDLMNQRLLLAILFVLLLLLLTMVAAAESFGSG
ncbi:hypothetical protein [Acidipila sp. EB88]|uniref:hypothetical protein n=1 Tax=Acidipila sp. EB88 TaxID=2305226 RepID=UPI000F5F78C0|nr:hypothetical protein [Acidipila sp. EB88]